MLFIIITTIQEPTACILEFKKVLCCLDKSRLIVAGDKKGPTNYSFGDDDFDKNKVVFMGLQDQLESGFGLAHQLPTGHYARKNIGYLKAIAMGAECIYETDDDNAPMDSWHIRSEVLNDARIVKVSEKLNQKWVNVYKYFTDENIWPRGLPLDEIKGGSSSLLNREVTKTQLIKAPIQQGLANNSPDVDAIWRLVLGQLFTFQDGPSVMLPAGTWCPFNSQSTWWWPDAYPLLYLPSYCSFRMTDIWRSFIAQRCLWEIDQCIVFHSPEVIQDRNKHNLMKDFKDEVSGYLDNKELVMILQELSLDKGLDSMDKNLIRCYEALIDAEFFPEKELELLETWLSDLNNIDTNTKK